MYSTVCTGVQLRTKYFKLTSNVRLSIPNTKIPILLSCSHTFLNLQYQNTNSPFLFPYISQSPISKYQFSFLVPIHFSISNIKIPILLSCSHTFLNLQYQNTNSPFLFPYISQSPISKYQFSFLVPIHFSISNIKIIPFLLYCLVPFLIPAIKILVLVSIHFSIPNIKISILLSCFHTILNPQYQSTNSPFFPFILYRTMERGMELLTSEDLIQ